MSNFIFRELSIQLVLIIELLLTFNRSIKSTIRFLTKISKLSVLLTTYMIVLPLLLGCNFT